MRLTQLRLLKVVHPFCLRWPSRFFRAVPRAPGVYRMHGRPEGAVQSEVLYVGKAANLRQRLSSYRSAAATSPSRKTRRLLGWVDGITWEVCSSEREACLLENRLIQQLRPRFNRAQVWPRGYWFVGIESAGGVHELRLRHECEGGGEWFGAFKSRGGFAALARCLWVTRSPDGHRPPAKWFDWDGPRSMRFRDGGKLGLMPGGSGKGRLSAYFGGRSDELVDVLEDVLLGAKGVSHFDCSWRRRDLDLLREFYERGPRRNRLWAMRLGYCDGLIPPQRLDALSLGEMA